MISEKNQISKRQLRYLLISEWMARLCILLPAWLQGKRIGSQMICIVVGLLLWCAAVRVTARWMRPGETFFEAIHRGGGKILTVFVCVTGLLYFLSYAAVLLYIWGELAALYLLPKIPAAVLCLFPLASGMYLSCKSLKRRARICEAAGPLLLGLTALAIFLAAFGMDAYRYEETAVSFHDHLGSGAWEVFASLGIVFFPVLSGYTHGAGVECTVQKAGVTAAAAAGSLCIVISASFGAEGVSSLSFPAVQVMRNVRVPGGFVQRWDLLFLLLLLFSLTAAEAGAFWYLHVFWTEFWKHAEGVCVHIACVKSKNQEKKTQLAVILRQGGTAGWWILASVSYVLAAGFAGEIPAVGFYRAYLIQLLLPGMLLLFPAAVLVRKKLFNLTDTGKFKARILGK